MWEGVTLVLSSIPLFGAKTFLDKLFFSYFEQRNFSIEETQALANQYYQLYPGPLVSEFQLYAIICLVSGTIFIALKFLVNKPKKFLKKI